ncbi:MAG: glucosidase [Candidatus Krumholzibacteria bacterium]|nr:glucosidase [Candidatus Krumholzibacteria bacterium]
MQKPLFRRGGSTISAEQKRLREARDQGIAWKKWGPYLSERQWGTVREDYGTDGNAWDHFPHSQSVARAYRSGEDGLAGISDDRQLLCFSVAVWNGADPMLKERLFGLSNGQGNHGEDCKEYYFYLDSTPTHSYLKFLYKYPQAAFPYADLLDTNAGRGYDDPEYELLDTGAFDDDRYFDVLIEYAKAGTEDILIRISVTNRGPSAASIRVLPTLWYRNVWTWENGSVKPLLAADNDVGPVRATGSEAGDFHLYCDGSPKLLFTENETNHQVLTGGTNASLYTKDGINRFVVHGEQEAVNSDRTGTKAAADYELTVPAGGTEVLRLRLTTEVLAAAFGSEFDSSFATRQEEADEFFDSLAPAGLNEDERRVMRQALAGMLWSKQYYEYDVKRWLADREAVDHPRNREWAHMQPHDILSMPDKGEYPWYAVWDLAFHTLALMLVDTDFAKQQLALFLEDRYQHPDGQIPAYEWNFGDVNPPVHAWATYAVYDFDKQKHDGQGDIDFLKKSFARLDRNFDWWVAQKGPEGTNVFEGGFLGLDNIGVFDRSKELPTGGRLEQSDGTAWMALFAQNMLSIALELSRHDAAYKDAALVYLERFLEIAAAMDRIGDNEDEMWDEADGFFYDVMRFPDGSATRLKVRSLVGLLPLCAVTVFDPEILDELPLVKKRYEALVASRGEELQNIACPETPGLEGRRLLGILDDGKLRRVLSRMLDEDEFLGPYGIRSLSRVHDEQPYVFHWEDQQFTVGYRAGESDSGMFGGNSNWRGPVWMPANFMLIRGLLHLYAWYGDSFTIECPTGSGHQATLYEVAEEISRRLEMIFLRDQSGRRAVFGGTEKFQEDPHWRDHLLFYEYFHGDDGSGIGASHQTGWTGTIATIMQVFGHLSANDLKEGGVGEFGETVVKATKMDKESP